MELEELLLGNENNRHPEIIDFDRVFIDEHQKQKKEKSSKFHATIFNLFGKKKKK